MGHLRSSSSFASSSGTNKLFEDLCSLPHPRAARITNRGRVLRIWLIFAWVAFTVVIVLSDLQTIESKPFDLKSLALAWNIVFPVIGGFVLRVMIRQESKNRQLLERGSLALGIVVDQKKGGRGLSEIIYEFKNSDGASYQLKSEDRTDAYFPGMAVPVFYDPTDSSRSVAICGTYLRVVGRDGQLMPQK